MNSQLVAFVFLSMAVTAISACAPVEQTTVEATTVRRRRSIDESDYTDVKQPVIVTIVSIKPFDPATVQTNLELLHNAIAEYESREGIQYDVNTLPRETKNEGGKFAVEYKVEDDCHRVKNFVLGAKKNSHELDYATIKCRDDILIA